MASFWMRTVPSAELTCSTTPVAANTRSLVSSDFAFDEISRPDSARQINKPHDRIFLTLQKSLEDKSRIGQQADAVEPRVSRCMRVLKKHRASRRHIGADARPIVQIGGPLNDITQPHVRSVAELKIRWRQKDRPADDDGHRCDNLNRD